MRILAGLLAALVLACGAAAGDLDVPATVTGDVGDFIRVPATTQGKTVKWQAIDKGLKLFPVDLLKDTRTAVASAAAAGKYRLLCWTSINGEPSDAALCVVVVGNPAPDPGPAPTPAPPDPLAGAIQRAYAAETDPQKAALAAGLAKTYRAVAALAPGFQSWAELPKNLSAAGAANGVAGKLPGVQQAVGEEGVKIMPAGDLAAAMSAADRAALVALLTRAAQALDAVK